ncbi:uncharacterized protein B0J16DRAFT_66568 [Fusarium flagelliforme]|uniref:uncharacterized protein n=1 Tax=Fusarium flagelliforme TaxID=2675880 RepID=UPI001E8E1785|nr:uncharacterized protein B0J16DRAFT_66568 [Fusarium flagelliforme]KAH7192858.1 hypothetical protein B0J16DRAFT_66568 [Fusarium flagelliforme]
MRFLAVVGACLPLISGSPVDISRSDLSVRDIIKYEPLCGVVGSKPNPIVTKSLKCRLVDCRELCSATSNCESYGKSRTQCLLFSSRAAESFRDDASSPFILYDLACPEITSSTAAVLPETTASLTASLTSESGVTMSSDATTLSELPSTPTTELGAETSSESTSATASESSPTTVMASETTTAESTDLDDITSTAVTLTTSVITTSAEAETTTTAEGSTTVAGPSIPTFGILRMENTDGSTLGYVSEDLPLRMYGPQSAALKFHIPALEEGSTSQLDLVHANPGGQDDGLTRLCGVPGFHNQNADLGLTSYHYAFISASVSLQHLREAHHPLSITRSDAVVLRTTLISPWPLNQPFGRLTQIHLKSPQHGSTRTDLPLPQLYLSKNRQNG